ncbi:unnamed protein product [Sphagnum troendelagicum]|uniref:Protein kinase domain-containing protein n=1 Tax=Sphagnum troendelagicum TaxID=128251 RepID=A0ABP0USW3_9BRYO
MRPGHLVLLVVVCFLLISDGRAQYLTVADQQHLTMFLENVSPDPSALGFNSSVPACEWPGIVCSQQQRISSVTINGKGLKGTIPPGTLGMLSSLKVLDLVNNSLMGEIPSDIGNLTSLTFLILAYNNLNGSIPSSIGSLGQLKLLDLSFNELVGEIPVSFNKLWSLQLLNLKENHLSGSLPLLQSSWDLEVLDVSSNLLIGGIPPQVLNFCVRLQVLNLSNNGLSGNVPFEITKLNLEFLDLSYNNLWGSLPPEIGNCTQLRLFNVQGNQITGLVPDEIGGLRNLECLGLGKNQLYGNLPQSLTMCTELYLLDASRNQFSGLIPSWLSKLQRLQFLVMHSNSFTGDIPIELFSSSSNLLHLDLGHNNLTGFIPPEIGNLGALRFLRLSRNQLTGSVPSTIGNLSQVTAIDLSGNLLTGSIPATIGELQNLLWLQMSKNLLSGSIPGELSNCGSLLWLNLYQNQLTGEIPATFSLLGQKANITSGNSGFAASPASAVMPKHLKLIVTLTVSVLGCLTALLLRRRVKTIPVEFFDGVNLPPCLQSLTYSDLLLATDGFSDANVIGDGGFGIVYKARLGPDNTQVAIKKLFKNGVQGEREFQAEMETLGNIRHQNLVPLLGYCCRHKERLLVYKFMENGSLDHWLYSAPAAAADHQNRVLSNLDSNKKKPPPSAAAAAVATAASSSSSQLQLDWSTRLRIAHGTARGLCFLHHECVPMIIHRDMKVSNILLDEALDARLTDFGLARLLDLPNTHVSTIIAGTPGYVAPEYSQTWKATTKGDVYSFGVVLLELVAGKRPTAPEFSAVEPGANLVDWVRFLVAANRQHEVCDKVVLETAGDPRQVGEFLALALSCTLDSASKRPTMIQVTAQLQQIMDKLQLHDSQQNSAMQFTEQLRV